MGRFSSSKKNADSRHVWKIGTALKWLVPQQPIDIVDWKTNQYIYIFTADANTSCPSTRYSDHYIKRLYLINNCINTILNYTWTRMKPYVLWTRKQLSYIYIRFNKLCDDGVEKGVCAIENVHS